MTSPAGRAVDRSWGLLGVPSSAAAHWPGIEKAPAALRAAGLVNTLRATGVALEDHGDLPVTRWRAAGADGTPNNVGQVADVLRATSTEVGAILDAGERPLVLGGECTVVIGVVDAFVSRGVDVALVYVDGGQDLMIPVDHPEEPILDGMGVAHVLDLPGTVAEIAAVGARRPLLTAERIAFVGYADEEEDVHGLVPSARFTAADVATDQSGTARAAIKAVGAGPFVVHVDVDVLDFLDTPAADVPIYGRGLTLPQLVALLRTLVADPRCAAMTFVEHNPDHGAPGGGTTRALVAALAEIFRADDEPAAQTARLTTGRA
ncbi:arginase family protein [Nakamurella sp. GG22]